jgi:hypothetical protein
LFVVRVCIVVLSLSFIAQLSRGAESCTFPDEKSANVQHCYNSDDKETLAAEISAYGNDERLKWCKVQHDIQQTYESQCADSCRSGNKLCGNLAPTDTDREKGWRQANNLIDHRRSSLPFSLFTDVVCLQFLNESSCLIKAQVLKKDLVIDIY